MAELESNELERSFLDTLQTAEVADVPGDLIDTFAGFPIASTLKKLSRGVSSLRDYFFAKKVVRFVTNAAAISPRERQEQLSKLLVVPGERERFAEQLLLSLERLDDTRKASIMGNLSVGLIRGQITLLEFWRMNRAVEAISLDEEWPILKVLEEYKSTYYEEDGRPMDENWRHEGVFREMVNEKLGLDLSDGDLRSIVLRVNQTGLFGLLGWRHGPAHDCELAPWYFKLKPLMTW